MRKLLVGILIFTNITLLGSCHLFDELNGPKFDKIGFDRPRVNMTVGEEVSVIVNASSSTGESNEKIDFSTSKEGIVEIKSYSNNGFILRGIGTGDVVIIAKAEKVTGYIEVRVEGGDYIFTPYILVGTPVIEMNEGEMRNIQISLHGGSALDNNGFTYKIEEEKDNIKINYTLNNVVVHGQKKGNQKIIISHPKAEFDSEILVFVKKANENIKYITSDKNVLLIEADGQYVGFNVNLFGGSLNDKRDFDYEIVEGENLIEVLRNNEVFNIKGNNEGTALLRITHPLAEVEFNVRIILVIGKSPLIILNKTFVIIGLEENTLIEASIENAKTVMALNEFSFSYEGNASDIINVIQTNNQFFILAKRGGLAKIVIKNEQAKYNRELLVYVRTSEVYRDGYYITTSQNVIQTQVGDNVIQLQMLLVGGNIYADANSFEWTVSDGYIIRVDTGHGEVLSDKNNIMQWDKEDNVSIRQRSQINDVAVATALIKPLRSGVATITISHPKSESIATVLVKVYPKNTFAGTPIIVKTEGLIKLLLGDEQKRIDLEMVSGNAYDIGDLDWSVKDRDIASVNGDMRGMINYMGAVGQGQTKLTVNGGNLRQPHESIVLAGDADYLKNANIIYADSVFQQVAVGHVNRVDIKNSQGANLTGFKINVDNPEFLYAVMVNSQLVLQGKSPGQALVKITNKAAGVTNELEINVRVEAADLSMEFPYYIEGPEIVGVINEKSGCYVNGVFQEKLKVKLVGATPVEIQKLEWTMETAGVVEMIGKGEEALITGISNKKQTNITISHKKSRYSKTIILYTVGDVAELDNYVVLGVDKKNYSLIKGEELFINLKTNVDDTIKQGILWESKDSGVVYVTDYKDSAMLRAVGAGNTQILIEHVNNILPVVIYVSVVDAKPEEKIISFPSTVEVLIGESRVIEVNERNLSALEKTNITWGIEDTNIASVQGNGETAYLIGKGKGVSYLNIALDRPNNPEVKIKYNHRATLLCAATRAELETMYIIGVPTTYHVMTVGDEKKITLEFGSAGFPEDKIKDMVWTAGANGVVRVINNGASATIVAQNAGSGTVKVTNTTSLNELEIKFEVHGKGVAPEALLKFGDYEKTKGILLSETDENKKKITFKLYNGANEVTSGYSLLKYTNSNDNIITILPVDNVVKINPLTAGQSFIEADHDDVEERAKVLIYTAATQAELDAYYPIVAEKNNYLLRINETVDIKIITETSKDNTNSNLSDITWGLVNGTVIKAPEIISKKHMRITGQYPGDCQINISHKGKVVERIYISVIENSAIDFTKRINTENIIGLVKGNQKVTTIVTNLKDDEISQLSWESTNTNIVTVQGNGKSATITANPNATNNSEAYITVSFGNWLKRHILVYVCDSQEEVKNYKAMNMENQYIRMSKNETIILPVFYAPNKPTNTTVWEDKYDNNVVNFKVVDNGSKIEVTSVNEGVAILNASNTGRTNNGNPMSIYFEVSNEYKNIPREPELKYITISKTVYLMNPDEPGKELELQVSGIGMSPSEMTKLKWSKNNNNIDIFPNGDKCRVILKTQNETNSTIKVFYEGANELEIKILISRNSLLEGLSVIMFDDIVRLGMNETRNKVIDISGVTNFDPNELIIGSQDRPDILEITKSGATLQLKALKPGQTRFTIDHPLADFAKEVIVVVASNESGIIYLTTKDNFSVINKDEYKTLIIDIMGYEEGVAGNFNWRVKEGQEDIIDIVPNGKQIRVKGKQIGTAEIIASHIFAYPVSLYVRVSEIEMKPLYITTTQNIISITEGTSRNVDVKLVNGNESQNWLFEWRNLTRDIIDLNSASQNAIIRGLTAGVGRILITHPETLNQIEIVVMVDPDMTSSGIYITTDEVLVEMKPNESNRRVSVKLIGGLPEDIYGFKWQIIDQNSLERNSSDGTSKVVIDMTTGNDSVFLTAKNEGEASIRVTHPKTNYKLDIKINVRLFSNIQFTKRDITINMGDTLSVEVNAPTGVKIFYDVQNPNGSEGIDIATATGTNRVCVIEGISAGTVVITARNALGTMSDEIIVVVKYVNNALVRYIRTQQNYIILTENENVTTSAYTVGKKSDGSDFTVEDNTNIIWELVSGSSNKIELSPSSAKGQNITIKGKVFGDAEILLKHPLMAGYTKRLYVRVNPEDTSFQLSKNNILMTVDEHEILTCIIDGRAIFDYEDVEWTNLNPNIISLNDYGVAGVNDNSKKSITALSAGTAVVRVEYQGISRNCTILVQDQKSLTITGMPNVDILPGQTYSVFYTVTPSDTPVSVTWNNDYYAAITHDSGNKKISLEGKNEEGITTITIKADNLTKIVNVRTHKNYTFKWRDALSFRGTPKGGPYFVYYDILPEQCETIVINKGDLSKIADVFEHSPLQRIEIQPKKAGFDTIKLQSTFDKNQIIELPVYLYYDNIIFDFKITNNNFVKSDYSNSQKYSRIDKSKNAIYVGDGEEFRIIPDVNEAVYMNHGLILTESNKTQNNNLIYVDTTIDISNQDVNVLYLGDYISIKGNAKNQKTQFSYESRDKEIYVGLLKVHYAYYNGGKTMTPFVKNYLIYYEIYNRK